MALELPLSPTPIARKSATGRATFAHVARAAPSAASVATGAQRARRNAQRRRRRGSRDRYRERGQRSRTAGPAERGTIPVLVVRKEYTTVGGRDERVSPFIFELVDIV